MVRDEGATAHAPYDQTFKCKPGESLPDGHAGCRKTPRKLCLGGQALAWRKTPACDLNT